MYPGRPAASSGPSSTEGKIDNAPRTPAFDRSQRLEILLERLNGELAGVTGAAPDSLALDADGQGVAPIVFVVGAPRTGSTLLMQRLAASGAFAYPSNLVARFWTAPQVGALVQRMLAEPEFAFRNEFADIQGALRYAVDNRSDLGKTEGLLAPNEFWYFWRRFFRFGETHQLTPDAVSSFDGARFASDLRRLRAVFGKPLVLKAMLATWHIELLAETLPEAFFLYLDRDPAAIMASLLDARRRHTGRPDVWYSLKPPSYETLLSLPPEDQVAGQVHEIRTAVEEQLARLPSTRWRRITYEDLCADPAATLRTLAQALEGFGYQVDLPSNATGPVAEGSE